MPRPALLPYAIELLPVFLAVAEAGSISAAARALYISQPSVTAHIRRLEEQLAVPLFTRSVSGMLLTPEGRRFHDQATAIMAQVQHSAASLRHSAPLRGHLTIAASTTIADYILPPLIAAFCQRYPQTQVRLLSQNTHEVLGLIRDRKAHVGLVEGLARAPLLSLETFMEDELLLIAAPAIARTVRSIHDLLHIPLLIREQGSGTRTVVQRALAQAGIALKQFHRVVEIGSTNAIKRMAESGFGIGFVSRAALMGEIRLHTLEVIRLGSLEVRRTLSWVRYADSHHPPEHAFYRFVTDERNGIR